MRDFARAFGLPLLLLASLGGAWFLVGSGMPDAFEGGVATFAIGLVAFLTIASFACGSYGPTRPQTSSATELRARRNEVGCSSLR